MDLARPSGEVSPPQQVGPTQGTTAPGTERIGAQRQDRATVAPVETYRIDGTFVGRKNTFPDATTHQLKNGKKVKVVR